MQALNESSFPITSFLSLCVGSCAMVACLKHEALLRHSCSYCKICCHSQLRCFLVNFLLFLSLPFRAGSYRQQQHSPTVKDTAQKSPQSCTHHKTCTIDNVLPYDAQISVLKSNVCSLHSDLCKHVPNHKATAGLHYNSNDPLRLELHLHWTYLSCNIQFICLYSIA